MMRLAILLLMATSVLAQEILPYMSETMPDLPIFVAGGIGHGEAIAAYLGMGAAGIQMGTRAIQNAAVAGQGPDPLAGFMLDWIDQLRVSGY